jgi:hypothetical protein
MVVLKGSGNNGSFKGDGILPISMTTSGMPKSSLSLETLMYRPLDYRQTSSRTSLPLRSNTIQPCFWCFRRNSSEPIACRNASWTDPKPPKAIISSTAFLACGERRIATRGSAAVRASRDEAISGRLILQQTGTKVHESKASEQSNDAQVDTTPEQRPTSRDRTASLAEDIEAGATEISRLEPLW